MTLSPRQADDLTGFVLACHLSLVVEHKFRGVEKRPDYVLIRADVDGLAGDHFLKTGELFA